jgi:hypothetical protein
MDSLMGSLAIFAPIAILAIPALYITFMMWRRTWGEERPLLLGRMLARQGVRPLAEAAMQREGSAFALAVRRCAMCASQATCNEWLDSGKKSGHAEFCPNAEFIERFKE